MRHPFQNISNSLLVRYFWILLGVTVLLGLLLNWISQPLTTEAAPFGIVSFEFAGNPGQAEAMLASWDDQAKLLAAFSLGFDYLLLITYSTTLVLACVWSMGILKRGKLPLASLGILLAWGQWAAAGFDGLENAALMTVLYGHNISPWPELAWCSAAIKFALIMAGAAFSVYGVIAAIIYRITSRKNATL
jgi:hypothetical protein